MNCNKEPERIILEMVEASIAVSAPVTVGD